MKESDLLDIMEKEQKKMLKDLSLSIEKLNFTEGEIHHRMKTEEDRKEKKKLRKTLKRISQQKKESTRFFKSLKNIIK
ncbi:MAG: hypothetical protein HQL82_12080 [Magnetococcales bacterium]|nr:hypothetical protein [Magnetococcales bacterium]